MIETGKPVKYYSAHTGSGGDMLRRKDMISHSKKELSTYIEELKKVNKELNDARRAAFNLLEDAVKSEDALRKSEQKYRTELEKEVLDRTIELKKSQHQYASLVENTPDLISRWNKQLRLVYANTAYAVKTGARLKDLYGKTVLETGQPHPIAVPFMENIQKVFETGKALEHFNSFPTPTGELHFYSRIVPEKNEKNEIDTVLSIARDITEIKNAEKEVLKLKDAIAKRATDRYYSLFNSIDEGFCVIEMIMDDDNQATDYRFLEVNQSFERQTGLTDVVGKLASEVSPDIEPFWFNQYGKVARTGEAIRFDSFHRGTDRWYESYASRIGDNDSLLIAVVFSDVTERKHNEQRQEFLLKFSDTLRPLSNANEIQYQAMKVIGEFFGLDRVLFNEIDADGTTYVTETNYLRDGTSPHIGKFTIEPFNSSVQKLRNGQTEIIYDVEAEMRFSEEEKNFCKNINVRAFVVIPLIKKGEWIWNLVVHSSVPRKWTEHEVYLMEEVAERTWAAVERAKAENVLAEELSDITQLQKLSSRLIEEDDPEVLYKLILDASMTIMRSDMGSIQLYIPESKTLLLVSQKGFHPESAKFWQWVHADDLSSCGISLQKGERIVISDMDNDTLLEGSEDLAAYQRSGIRSVQSTPLISRTGKMIGMFSTHWKIPYQPPERKLRLLDLLARQAADLLERKQSGDALRKSQAQLSAVFELTPVGIALINLKGEVVVSNKEMQRFLPTGKIPSRDLDRASKWKAYRPDGTLLGPEDFPSARALRGETVLPAMEALYTQDDGTEIWTSVVSIPIKDEKGEVIEVVAIVTDIDEFKRTTDRLKNFTTQLEKEVASRTTDLAKQHSILKQAEELAQAGSWEYNIKTQDFIWSDGMYQLFNLKKRKIVTPGIYLDHVVEEDVEVAAQLVNAIQLDPRPFEATLRFEIGGEIRIFRVKVAVFRNEKGEIEKTIGVDLDVTRIAESQDKINQLNNTLQRKNKELATVNSELKTFNSIAANDYHEMLKNLYISLELIVTQDARNISNTGRANLRRAQASIQKMKLLTEDLVSYSRLNEIHVRPADLVTIIEEIRPETERKNIEIKMGDGCQQVLQVDLSLVTLMFHHLLDNSIRHKKDTELPVVEVSCRSNSQSKKSESGQRKYHIVSFKDNGKGMSEEEIQNLFEISYSFYAKSRAGVGLAICKKIMEMHNGYLTIESNEGEGTTVNCFFPS